MIYTVEFDKEDQRITLLLARVNLVDFPSLTIYTPRLVNLFTALREVVVTPEHST
jgi:hypothetical protein